jgi:hypothetical protein
MAQVQDQSTAIAGALSVQLAMMQLARLVCLAGILLAAPGNADPTEDRRDDVQKPSSSLPAGVTDDPLLNSRFILYGSGNNRSRALRWIKRRGNTDMAAALIVALRFAKPAQRDDLVQTLQHITKRRFGDDWHRWMQWQQAHPEIKPFAGFDVFLSALLGSLDPGFKDFIYPGVEHTIRLEEVVWGGVRSKDGIPSLDSPRFTASAEADYLTAQDLVFGVSINGDARAYPYRIMDWHEMANDVVGGVPVALAYCTLCGSGILYDTSTTNSTEPFVFGSSGLLYQSNKLMFDRKTHSLWNQFTGRPVVGELVGKDLALPTLPLVTISWEKWLAQHPQTKVLDIDTGHQRDYSPGAAYGKYFKSPNLMFPTLTDDRQLKQKELVFGLRMSGIDRAWPLSVFAGGRVINDQVGVLKLVLVGDAQTRTVRAYRRGDWKFTAVPGDATKLLAGGTTWRLSEAALISPDGEQLTRLPGHLSFWFAWHNYLGGETLSKPDS